MIAVCNLQETEELGSSVDALRAEPLGTDSKGARFWFFGTAAQEDCWLYRERVPNLPPPSLCRLPASRQHLCHRRVSQRCSVQNNALVNRIFEN